VELLREYITSILSEKSRIDGRRLRVFDFDDTLVKTNSKIYVTSGTGDKFELTPGEYAVYESQPGDEFDYSDFSKLIDPREIVWTGRILRNILSKGGEVVILTARSAQAPVYQFLEDAGLPRLEVVALANADPEKKADYIEKRIVDDGVKYVEFFDDSYKNVEAVNRRAAKYPSVKVISRHIVHKTEI
jgi:phosphoglycolate phosphatase-like HAD superfamily hydrolase